MTTPDITKQFNLAVRAVRKLDKKIEAEDLKHGSNITIENGRHLARNSELVREMRTLLDSFEPGIRTMLVAGKVIGEEP